MKQWSREIFVPLSHALGHALVDFGNAYGLIGGVECKLHYFAMELPYSDAFFIEAYPVETMQAFCDAHNAAFAGMPLPIEYDNTRSRWRGPAATANGIETEIAESQSHCLFEERFAWLRAEQGTMSKHSPVAKAINHMFKKTDGSPSRASSRMGGSA